MGGVARISINRTALPAALLPTVKAHCRVEFSRDDQYLTGVAGRAIDLFERLTEWAVFQRLYKWSISADEGADFASSGWGEGWAWRLPLAPVTISKAVIEPGGIDVTSEYSIVANVPDGRGESFMVRELGKPDPMPSVVLQGGYALPDDMPPGVLDFTLRASAWLYENREAALMPGADMMAYANSLLTSYWLPKA